MMFGEICMMVIGMSLLFLFYIWVMLSLVFSSFLVVLVDVMVGF